MACSTTPAPALQRQLGGQRKAIWLPACLAGTANSVPVLRRREKRRLCANLSVGLISPHCLTLEGRLTHSVPCQRPETPQPRRGPLHHLFLSQAPSCGPREEREPAPVVGRQPGRLCCPRGPCSPLGHPGRSASLLHSRGFHSAIILGKCAKVVPDHNCMTSLDISLAFPPNWLPGGPRLATQLSPKFLWLIKTVVK